METDEISLFTTMKWNFYLVLFTQTKERLGMINVQ